jgi:hypothetical protein
MARLRRHCHRLIWLNPLLGQEDYRPVTAGMRAALPFIDDFLPANTLDSLLALGRVLEAMDDRRRTEYTKVDGKGQKISPAYSRAPASPKRSLSPGGSQRLDSSSRFG